MTDQDLLQRFLRHDDHAAFTELVRRHSAMVVTVATRVLGERSLAEDVAQKVYILLARKAPQLKRHPTLAAWLHRTTRYEAIKMRQSTQRRQRRERIYLEAVSPSNGSRDMWEQALPHLDHALDKLSLNDRNLILLRYHQNKRFREIATLLGKSEAACRMRASRAVGKLSRLLRRHGLVVPAATATQGFLAYEVKGGVDGLSSRLAEGALASVASTRMASLRTILGSKGGWLALVAGSLVILDLSIWSNTRRETDDVAMGSYPPTLSLVARRAEGSDGPRFQLAFEFDAHEELLGSHFVEKRASYSFFRPGDDGLVRLNDLGIRYVNIREAEVPPLEAAARWLWSEMIPLTNAHTVLDPIRNDPAAGIMAIRIAPFDATALLQGFMHEVESILGPRRALKLLSGFPDNGYFGAFGRLEVLAQLHEHSDPPGVSYSTRDPNTGHELGSGRQSLSEFEAVHGRLALPPAGALATLWKPMVSDRARSIEVIDDDLKLTTAGIESARIPAQQALALQETLEDWFKEMSDLMQAHTSKVASDDPQRTKFEVDPFPDQGAASLQKFQREIGDQLGAERSERFLGLLDPSQYFCGCGKNALEVEFFDAYPLEENVTYAPGAIPPYRGMRANSEETEPETGESVRSTQGTYRMFRNRYGDFLKIIGDL